jgi:hypothetical protein
VTPAATRPQAAAVDRSAQARSRSRPDEIVKQLGEADIPNLWLPAAVSFIEVGEIPILGTGKLDLRALKQPALEKAGQVPANQPS